MSRWPQKSKKGCKIGLTGTTTARHFLTSETSNQFFITDLLSACWFLNNYSQKTAKSTNSTYGPISSCIKLVDNGGFSNFQLLLFTKSTMDVVQTLHHLSLNVCCNMLPNLFPFGLSILVPGIPDIIPHPACCYAIKAFEIGVWKTQSEQSELLETSITVYEIATQQTTTTETSNLSKKFYIQSFENKYTPLTKIWKL